MVKIKGGEEFQRKLDKLSRKSEKLGSQIAFLAADELKSHVVKSITQGSVGGRGHVASNPGEPPNADTGDLHRSIVVKRKGRTGATVTAGGRNAPYAPLLEEGTKRMKARPYMAPGVKKLESRMVEIADKALRKFTRRTR